MGLDVLVPTPPHLVPQTFPDAGPDLLSVTQGGREGWGSVRTRDTSCPPQSGRVGTIPVLPSIMEIGHNAHPDRDGPPTVSCRRSVCPLGSLPSPLYAVRGLLSERRRSSPAGTPTCGGREPLFSPIRTVPVYSIGAVEGRSRG